MKLFLIGLPGSGKSTLGKELSNLLQLPLIDTDDVICKREEQSIEAIFQNKGEDYFRNLERVVLHELLGVNNSIISTGGGLPCFFDNMEVINKYGISIFLNVTPESITERLWTHENQNRPLLKGKSKEDLLKFLKLKYLERDAYYSKAKLIVTGDQLSGQKVVDELKSKNLI